MVDRKTPLRGIGRGRDADPVMARVDRALSQWPSPPEDRAANDARAAAVLSGISDASRASDDGSTDDDLLAPPLPAARDEGASPPLAGARPVAWLRSRGAVLVASVAIAAIAAGFVAIGVRHPTGDEGLATKTQAAPAGSQAIRVVPAPPVEPAAGTLDVPGVDPASLPLAAAGGPAAAGPVPGPAPRRPGSMASVARPSGASAPSRPASNGGDTVEPGLDPTLVPAAAVAPGSSLGPGPWSVPRRPSFGAVQGAFGAVLPTARACLDPTDPPCRATVTFQSDGTVRDVSLADVDPTKAECVKAALGKASVAAFAEGAYAAPVTVRAPAR